MGSYSLNGALSWQRLHAVKLAHTFGETGDSEPEYFFTQREHISLEGAHYWPQSFLDLAAGTLYLHLFTIHLCYPDNSTVN